MGKTGSESSDAGGHDINVRSSLDSSVDEQNKRKILEMKRSELSKFMSIYREVHR